MSRRCVQNTAAIVIVVFAFSLQSLSATTMAQSPSSDKPTESANDKAADPSSSPQQPGDDVSEELNDPVRPTDDKKAEAHAAYMTGVAAQKKGEFGKALEAFRKAAKTDPQAAAPVRAESLLQMRLGRMGEAERLARKAVSLDVDDYDTRLQLAGLLSAGSRADAKAREEQLTEAVRLIEEALKSKNLKPQSMDLVRIHRARGRLYIETANAPKAAESYGVLLEALNRPEDFELDYKEHQALMNDRVTGYETIGKVMLEIGKYDKAADAFSALIRVNNDKAGDHHYWLALTQYRKDDLEAAEKNLERYFETNRRDKPSLRLLADLYNATSRTTDVPTKLRALAKDTNDADTVNMFLGDLLVDNGKGAEAADVYRSIILDSANADAYIGLIRVDILNHDAESLLQSVGKALRARIQPVELIPLAPHILNDPEFGKSVIDAAVEQTKKTSAEHNPAATFFFSQIAEELKLVEQEGNLLQATLDQNPTARLGLEVMKRLGLNLYMQEKFTDAIEIFKRLLSVPGLQARERAMTLYRLSAAETETGNYDGAIAAVETALKFAPQSALLTYQLGTIQTQAEKYDDAEATLRKATQLAKGNPDLSSQCHLLLGSLFSQFGRWNHAIAEYAAVLKIEGISEQKIQRTKSALSNAHVQAGDLASGEKILEEIYAENPDKPGINNDLGYLYADQNKKLEQAEKMIRIAIESDPDNHAYLDSLGWVLYRLEKYEPALEALLKATAEPNSPDSTILEHLGDVQTALSKTDDARKSWEKALKVQTDSAYPDPTLVERLSKKLGVTPKTTPADKEETKATPAEDVSTEDQKESEKAAQ